MPLFLIVFSIKVQVNGRAFIIEELLPQKSNIVLNHQLTIYLFHSYPLHNILTSTCAGGDIKQGHLIGIVAENGEIEMHYHHININNEFKTGICQSNHELWPNGKIRLHENWQWTSGDLSSGNSILEEI